MASIAERHVLITGGGGFLARHLASALAAGGNSVILVRRPAPEGEPLEAESAPGTVIAMHGDRRRRGWERLKALEGGMAGETVSGREPARSSASLELRRREDLVVVSRVDLEDREAVRALLAATRPSLVFHLAADTRVDRRLDLLVPQVKANVLAGAHLLEAAIEAGVERLVWVGTCEEYGDGPAPFREDQLPRPVSPYSSSKLAGSMMAWMAARTMGAPTVVVRPFLTYGPNQPETRFIAQAIHAAIERRPFPMTPGEQTRDLLYVSDTVGGLIAAGTTPDVAGEIFNLASGLEHRLVDVARLIFELAEADPTLVEAGALPYRKGETARFFGDPEKAARLLGWRAEVGLEDGLRRTIAWCRARRAET